MSGINNDQANFPQRKATILKDVPDPSTTSTIEFWLFHLEQDKQIKALQQELEISKMLVLRRELELQLFKGEGTTPKRGLFDESTKSAQNEAQVLSKPVPDPMNTTEYINVEYAHEQQLRITLLEHELKLSQSRLNTLKCEMVNLKAEKRLESSRLRWKERRELLRQEFAAKEVAPETPIRSEISDFSFRFDKEYIQSFWRRGSETAVKDYRTVANGHTIFFTRGEIDDYCKDCGFSTSETPMEGMTRVYLDENDAAHFNMQYYDYHEEDLYSPIGPLAPPQFIRGPPVVPEDPRDSNPGTSGSSVTKSSPRGVKRTGDTSSEVKEDEIAKKQMDKFYGAQKPNLSTDPTIKLSPGQPAPPLFMEGPGPVFHDAELEKSVDYDADEDHPIGNEVRPEKPRRKF